MWGGETEDDSLDSVAVDDVGSFCCLGGSSFIILSLRALKQQSCEIPPEEGSRDAGVQGRAKAQGPQCLEANPGSITYSLCDFG